MNQNLNLYLPETEKILLNLNDSHEQINILGSLLTSMSKFPDTVKFIDEIKYLHGKCNSIFSYQLLLILSEKKTSVRLIHRRPAVRNI